MDQLIIEIDFRSNRGRRHKAVPQISLSDIYFTLPSGPCQNYKILIFPLFQLEIRPLENCASILRLIAYRIILPGVPLLI